MAFVIAVALAWQRRTELVNRMLATALAPWHVETGNVQVEFGARAVELHDVRFKKSATDEDWAHARRLRVLASWQGLKQNRIESAELEGLRLHVTGDVVDELVKWAAKPDAGSGQQSSSLGALRIRDASVTIDLPNLPSIETSFDYAGANLNFKTSLQFGPQQLHLKQFNAEAKDSGTVKLENAKLEFSLSDKHLTVHDVTIPRIKLHVTPELVAARGSSPTETTRSAASEHLASTWSFMLEKLRCDALDFRFSGYSQFPEISFQAKWNGEAAAWSREWMAGFQHFEVSELLVIDPSQATAPVLSIPSLQASLSGSAHTGLVVENAKVDRASLQIRPIVLDWLATLRGVPTPPADQPAAAVTLPGILLKDVALSDAAISVIGMTDSPHLPAALPDAHWKMDGTVQSLKLQADGKIQSSAIQRMLLRKAQAAFSPASPFLMFASAEIEVVPDDFLATKQVGAFRWQQPVVHLSQVLFDSFRKKSALESSKTASPARDAAKAATVEEPSFWYGLHAKSLVVTDGHLTLSGFGSSFPNIETAVSIQTDDSLGHYHVDLAEVKVAAPTLPELPFGRLPSVAGEVHPLRLWERRIESVAITGASIDIGETIRSLAPTERADSSPSPNHIAAPTQDQPWQIGKLAVTETQVTVSNIIPLLDPVAFDLHFSASELPLSQQGLLGQNDPQRIELTGLRLNASSPTGPLPVASFETVFIGFSLAGLLQQRIDHIELVSPVVYVGEQLFWYIDYFRKTSGTEARPLQTAASATGPVTPPASRAVADLEAPEEKGWSVSRIDAHFGRMVLALKGDVLDALPPLPFSCSTELEKGRAELVLEIPRGTYRPSSRIALELDVEEGSAAFNLPLKQESNNLVQMFRVSELRYGRGKPFRAQNAYASVTYDKDGVYAKFGGKLYGGYASGAFDLYLDDNLSWDGWLFGERIDTRPLTDIMTPEYFRMNGTCGFKLVAYGDVKSLYTASGNISAVTAGEMTFIGLDPLKEKLPAEWSALQRSLTESGLNTLRDFPFETCRGNFEIFGREANLKLDVEGPAGRRAFDLRVHDHTAPRLSGND